MTLAARDLVVHVGDVALLQAASLELSGGEIVAVLGPNGAGKTTLVRALASDLRPSRGQLLLDGRPLEGWSGEELARRRAVMSGAGTVAFGFSAREVALMGRMPTTAGKPTAADQSVVDELLAAVDCSRLADRVFATLSTGERQRVQLARAVAQVRDNATGAGSESGTDPDREARFLLLDEPTSSLDPAHQHGAMRLLRREADAGRGVLVVLHDLNLAAAYADRIVLMKAARIVDSGPPQQVLEPGQLEDVFEVPMVVVTHAELPHALVVARPKGE